MTYKSRASGAEGQGRQADTIRTARIVGVVIILLGCAQLVLYVVWSRRGALELFYFDPRIGFLLLEDLAGLPEHNSPTLLRWLSAFWQIGVGMALAARPRTLNVYLAAEVLLALPSLMFFAIVIWANISPAHGFSVSELLLPAAVFLVFTAVPWLVGLRSRRSQQRHETLS